MREVSVSSVILRKAWDLPSRALADERDWWSRRRLIASLGLAAGALVAPEAAAKAPSPATSPVPSSYAWKFGPAPDRGYALDRPLTLEEVAASHNNFYEFTTAKDRVWQLAHTLVPKPWTVTITGLVPRPLVIDLDDLVKKLGLEERHYRFRCVEAWSMAVPWLGVPLAALVKLANPLSSAKYVRFVTKQAPEMFPGILVQPWYTWPYHEGLSLAEATNELAFLAVGIYGHALPNQHGAPLRLVVPWKYGYKNIKSIDRIEFVEEEPSTFWQDAVADEYDFLGNVRPDLDHPRWSQASERVIPTGERLPTLMFNGYGEQVAGLYPPVPSGGRFPWRRNW